MFIIQFEVWSKMTRLVVNFLYTTTLIILCTLALRFSCSYISVSWPPSGITLGSFNVCIGISYS